VDAYTPQHIRVATRIADELGRIYLQSEQRRRTAAPIEDFHQRPDRFAELMSKSRLIKALKHDFLLYVIDYERRLLTGKHTSGQPIEYKFDERSLAHEVFFRRSPVHVRDAVAESKREGGSVNEKGVEMFQIRGPLFACPVRAAGQTEAVLVTWLRDGESGDDWGKRVSLFEASSSQVLRLGNLLANDIFRPGSSRVEQFLNGMYGKLAPIDHGEIWKQEDLQRPEFRALVLQVLLESVLSPEVGLKRVRVWQPVRGASGEPVAFQITHWLTTPDITDQGPEKYVTGKHFSADDVYTRYTISRYRHDPYAKWQHPAMFPKPDERAKETDKDPKGSWIVAPIVRIGGKHPGLRGFLSADMHMPTPDGPKDQRSDDPREIALQCRVLDVVSDLAQHVVRSSDQSFVQRATA
jgi:hypothetical protein